MILLVENSGDYNNDLRAMIGAFFPGEKIKAVSPEEVSLIDRKLFSEFSFVFTALYGIRDVGAEYSRTTRLRIEEKGHVIFSAYAYGDYKDRKKFRNRLKLASYRMLSSYTGRELPWGSLTGMRPSKIATGALKDGKFKDEIIDYYKTTYDTSEEKAELSYDVAWKEKGILETIDPVSEYAVYIGIPFCPTRCLYCSFTAYPIHEFEGVVDDYLKTLEQELQYISFLNRYRRLTAIYIGGGTPTAISEEHLHTLLDIVKNTFDLTELREYTVEAGRPDSITPEKLSLMKRYGVTRISINPQTMNAAALRKIGRAHTPNDTRAAFKMARDAGFNNINMDIIAGLPGERLSDMKYTLEEIRKMGPESLTVHSLAIKRTAELNMNLDEFKGEINQDMEAMISYAYKTADEMGLKPYYLYRQKNIAGNLENTGYSKPGLECLYNIVMIEEKMDVFAAGAGTVTRLISLDNNEVTRIDRVENVKNVYEYITRIDEMLERKSAGVDSRFLK